MSLLDSRPLGYRQQKALDLLKEHGPIYVERLCVYLKIDASDTRKLLSSLVARGLVRRSWIRSVVVYSLEKKAVTS